MAWTIAWQLHLSNRWSKSSVAWQLAKGVTWTCVAVIYLLPRTESHPCPHEADKVGGADFAGAGERQLLAHSYTATWGRETLCPDHPSCFFQAVPPLPEAYPGLHIIPPAVGEQWCPSATGTLRGARRPASSTLRATAQLPARRQHSRWLQLELLCSASRAPRSLQEGCEMPLVALSSASLSLPLLSLVPASL